MVKHIFLLMLACFSIVLKAQAKVVLIQNGDPGDYGKPHRNVLPVDYDENGVIVRSDSMLYNVEVTVKDQRGEVMNRQHLDLLPKTDNVISAPDSPDCEKRTIEIIVDKQKYFGYFE